LFNGQKRFKGRLIGVEGANISIKVREQIYMLPFNEIQKAKLLLTQELLDVMAHN